MDLVKIMQDLYVAKYFFDQKHNGKISLTPQEQAEKDHIYTNIEIAHKNFILEQQIYHNILRQQLQEQMALQYKKIKDLLEKKDKNDDEIEYLKHVCCKDNCSNEIEHQIANIKECEAKYNEAENDINIIKTKLLPLKI